VPRRRARRDRPREKAQASAGFAPYLEAYLGWLGARNYSAMSVVHRRSGILRFALWCEERGVARPQEVTRAIVERYQRSLAIARKPDGAALSYHTQADHLFTVKGFFKWAARNNHVLYNPASELEMPRLPRRLPRHVLTRSEVESVLAACALGGVVAVRDRAILETFYSTGLRRSELAHLKLYDLDWDSGCLWVREGKGKKDRVVPIGERAVHWTRRYLEELRAGLVMEPDEQYLFISDLGGQFRKNQLSDLAKKYLRAAGIERPGACHLFRHACATHMLEGGADIRFIQALLGHADLSTTEIYTRVSVKKLKEVHSATHPARLERAPGDAGEPKERGPRPVEENAASALLEALEAEREDEIAGGVAGDDAS
jgi:integrase/recombinase XerD